jgi:hypothetical protein
VTYPVQPSSTPPPLHVGQIVSRQHPEHGVRQHIRVEWDVTGMSDARQKLLLHLVIQAAGQFAQKVEAFTVSDVRLQLAKYENLSNAKTVGNGEPPPQEKGESA